MNTDVNTKIMAVIGDPVEHSMSPFMHNNIIEENGFNAVYFPFHVKHQELGAFVEAAKTLNFVGFNATMPHKQALLELVDEIDEEARRYQSVNAVQIRNGRLYGYNTDVRGLFQAFSDKEVELKGSRIMMIGAGGVAGSLVRGAQARHVGEITMLNRTLEKAEKICEGISFAHAEEMTPENMRKTAANADIIINCTSLGMAGVEDDFKDFSFLDETKALLCDLIYNPWETKFLSYGKQRGLKTMNGMAMLIYQGLISFEIFTGEKLDYRKEYERLFPLCERNLK